MLVGVLGAYAGILIAGLTLDLYAQIGPGRADRAGGQERHPHRRIRAGAAEKGTAVPREAATLGARMRFRSVMMTSIAFILGLVPLVWAHGAAQISRRDVGTFGIFRHAGRHTVGVFLIPMLYVVFQRRRERDFRWLRGRGHGTLDVDKQHLAKPAGE